MEAVGAVWAPSHPSSTTVLRRRRAVGRSARRRVQRGHVVVSALRSERPLEDNGSGNDAQSFAQRLDRAWTIARQPRPVPCSGCRASGEEECQWCHGTGVLTVGDLMLCTVDGNCRCRVCKGRGFNKCDRCKGTGQVASWLDMRQNQPD
eukprot:jgi/Chlat1/8496/Chrsp80S07887